MHRAALVTAALVASLLGGTSEAATQPFYANAAKEFSVDRGNPNGVWTYGWMTADFATFTPYAASFRDGSGVPVWYRTPASSDHTPCVWSNTTTSTRYGAAPQQLVLHPSNTGEASAVRWTASAAGFYRIRGHFDAGDTGQMSVGIRRATYGAFLWKGTDSGAFDVFVPDVSYSMAFFMPGDTVDFVVYGGYGSGNTPLEVEVIRQTAPVPTYDATAEYGIYQGNPDGPWSYGWLSSNFATFNPYDVYVHTMTDALQWFSSSGATNRTPTIWRNDSTVTQYGTAPGQLALHPSMSGEASVLRWTVPSPGYYDIHAHFSPGDIGVMQVGVRRTHSNGTAGVWLWQGVDSGTFQTDLLFLETGETIDFLVHGGYTSGNTPIEAVVVARPVGYGQPHLTHHDATAQFSTDRNPNGVWSYGWAPTGFERFSAYTGVTPEGVATPGSWWRAPAAPDFTPTIWRSNLTSVSHGVVPGELSLHPSSLGEASVLRFSAPAGGTYAFHARFMPGDIGSMSVGIRQGVSWLWTAFDSGSVHLTRSLAAGESVDFAVYDRYTSGNTPLELTVTPSVSPPSGAAGGCSISAPYLLTVEGRCEPGTLVGFDHETPQAPCSNGGYFSFRASVATGSSTLYLRGVQSGRPQSPVTAVQAHCP